MHYTDKGMFEKPHGKKILVTAGPTPVPIDNVRWISNIFGGTTGYDIAVFAAMTGNDITLLLGPHRIEKTYMLADEPVKSAIKKFFKLIATKARMFFAGGSLNIEHYRSFDELMALLEKHVSSGQFDAIIHSAAVADYAPVKQSGKIKSNLDKLTIETTPTPKLIKLVKGWDSKIFQVQFKLEVGLTEKQLIETAYASLVKYKSDLAVANNMAGSSQTTAAAYFIDTEKNIQKVATRENLPKELMKKILEKI